jgi:uncharacterized protein (UPF0332 family)
MIERWQFYIEQRLVRQGTPNAAESRALMERAIARLAFVEQQHITETIAPFVFEDIYESVREAGQALMELRGWKPYSHEAVIAFLREFHNLHVADLSSMDRYRILRNKIVYRAEKVTISTCQAALNFAKHFLPELHKEFDRLASDDKH